MDSFELNKIIGAILGTLLFVMGVGFVAEAIYHPIEGRGPGYDLPEPEGGTVSADVEAPVRVDIGTLLAAANVQQGEAAARARCFACHNFEQGSGHKTGPELFATVGHPIAGHDGYNYSPALLEHPDDAWTYENLDAFLLSPRDYAPGTRMGFGGLRDDRERANVIAYLASISPDAPPYPAPEPAADAETEVTDAQAVETPTLTQDETPVVGTPITEATPGGAEVVPEVPAQ